MNATASQCIDYLVGDAGLVKEQCEMTGGKFASSVCSTKNKLGSCDLGALHKRLTYYPGGEDNVTAKTAAEACKTTSGTWTP